MPGIDAFSDEELGKMLRNAASGREDEALEAMQSRNSLAEFLEEIGLGIVAKLIRQAVETVWNGLKAFVRSLFF